MQLIFYCVMLCRYRTGCGVISRVIMHWIKAAQLFIYPGQKIFHLILNLKLPSLLLITMAIPATMCNQLLLLMKPLAYAFIIHLYNYRIMIIIQEHLIHVVVLFL